MNRKLQIDIKSIEDSSHNYKDMPYQDQSQEQNDQRDAESQQIEQSQFLEEDKGNIQSGFDDSPSENPYQSIETFGNYLPKPRSPPQRLSMNYHNLLLPRQENITINHLSETPINQQHPPNSYTDRRHELEQSNLDDEIARIIQKVSKRSHTTKQTQEIQKVKKIDQINKLLLKENTELIKEINGLQTKLHTISSKMSFGKTKSKSRKALEENSVIKTLEQYREKLEKAMNLNSKLSNSLATEKSRSNIISNTFRSMTNRNEGSSSEIALSTLRNDRQTSVSRVKSKKPSNFSNINQISKVNTNRWCDKCCKQINDSKEFTSKVVSVTNELVFSPVLQVKDYQIVPKRVTNQFQLTRKSDCREAQCQVNMDESKQIEALQHLAEEQRQLLKIIQTNNSKIREYEYMLEKIVQIE